MAKAERLVVEVVAAHNLMPKDGQGSSSAYVEVEFEHQKRRTRPRPRELNPVWNERLVFPVADPDDLPYRAIDVAVYNDRPPSHNTPPQFPLPTTRPPPTWPLLAVPDLRIQIAETPPSGAAGVLIAGPNLCLPLPAQPPSRVASPTPHSRDQVDVHLYFD